MSTVVMERIFKDPPSGPPFRVMVFAQLPGLSQDLPHENVERIAPAPRVVFPRAALQRTEQRQESQTLSHTTRLIKPRIEVVDALRGFALLGLCLIHGLEHFDLLIYPETAPRWLHAIDQVAHGIVFFLFAGKAFAIFSFMFGLSFFIQMDRQAQRGVDFRWRFIWRLALLGLMGYLHGLIYCGDVLIIFAVMGVILVPLDKLRSKALLVLSLLLIANLPYLYQFFIYGRAWEIFSHGSFRDVVQFTAWQGQKMKWGWYLQEGRIWQILGLFLWGMVAGRFRFFESSDERMGLCKKLFVGSALGFSALFMIRTNLGSFELSDNAAYLAEKLISSYTNLAFTIVLITGFVLLYGLEWWRSKLSILAPLGRLSLTNYVGQSLVGVVLFYGFGFAMYQYFGHTLSLVFGIVLISLMTWTSRAWLRRFYYGPLEWAWRAATFMSLSVPFARRHEERSQGCQTPLEGTTHPDRPGPE